MSAHILLNLLNLDLDGKKNVWLLLHFLKMQEQPSIYCFLATSSIIQEPKFIM